MGTPVFSDGTDVESEAQILYTLEEKEIVQIASGVEKKQFVDYPAQDEESTVITVVKVFSVISLVLNLILVVVLFLFMFDRFRNKLIFLAGMNIVKVVVRLAALFAVITAVTAFLSLLGITSAFKKDDSNC